MPAHLRDDPGEVNTLFRDLLIGVTNFFRDAKAFEALEKLVMPRLLAGKRAQDTIRVWVPGCATGEEVYSLAIMLREQAEQARSRAKLQIFATDIDEASLAVARSGRYPDTLLEGVSKARLGRFFTAEGTSYVINKPIRDMVVFSSHSVVRDPPFSRMDLISCRNLLIYLNSELQGHVIPVFHYALKPGGFLFLGTSENIAQHADLFAPLDKRNRVFERRGDSVRLQLPLLFKPHGAGPGEGPREPVPRSLRETVEARVLDRHMPPHVVTTREGDIVYFSANTGKYLEAPAGRPSRSLLAMGRKGLRLPLRSVLAEAVESGRPVSRDNISVELEDRTEFVKLTVEPMREGDSESLYLIVFDERTAAALEDTAAKRRKARGRDPGLDQLERELGETRERLQSMGEEYETAIEELKSSNEEMVSVNEELQSTNEELETSKEELQSVNEELQTVNHELTAKIEELAHANSDLQESLREHGDRRHLPRPRADHPQLHAGRDPRLQSHPWRPRAAAHRHRPRSRLCGAAAGHPAGVWNAAGVRAAGRSRRRHRALHHAGAAVLDRQRQGGRRRGHIQRRHQPGARRGAAARSRRRAQSPRQEHADRGGRHRRPDARPCE